MRDFRVFGAISRWALLLEKEVSAHTADDTMPLMIALVAVPLVPLSCLALVLWMDHLEATLDTAVRRPQRRPRRRGLEATASGDASPLSADAVGVAAAGGSTNR
jgi:uncharacterized iron-regulated membrane protein